MNQTIPQPSFRIMYSGRHVEVFDYIHRMMKRHPGCELHIGCDSQNFKRHTVYVTAAVFRFPGHGAHVIYRKEKVEKINDMWTKLWGETERSVAFADQIQQQTGVSIKQIDLDFNEDPSYPSNKLLSASTGYIASFGYVCKAKPNLLMAAWAANVLCQ